MMIDCKFTVQADGWCDGVLRDVSPYFDARPPGAGIELLVIHNISLPAGSFGTEHVANLFTGRLDYNADPSFAGLRQMEVSVHFLIRRDGAVLQFVSCNDRAWHAGVSEFQGRAQCNQFSIGIEMEGSDFVAFTSLQYEVLSSLTLALQKRYQMAAVLGHQHIAAGRKSDPGPFFDWARYEALWQKAQAQGSMLVLTHAQLRFPAALEKVNLNR